MEGWLKSIFKVVLPLAGVNDTDDADVVTFIFNAATFVVDVGELIVI